MTTEYIERHLYDANMSIGKIYYIRIVRRGDSYVWDPDNEIMVATTSIAWEDTTTELVEEQDKNGVGTGTFPVVIQHDWRTVEDIAVELYGQRLCDLPHVTKETISQELYGKLLSELTDEQSSNVDTEYQERNKDRIAVGEVYQDIKNIPAGTYDIIVYEQEDSFPVNTDSVMKQWETKLGGSIFGF